MIFHSDSGCQDASAAYAALADDNAVTLSLGRAGQCWDNALAEPFFASLKGELIDPQAWPTRAMTRRAVAGCIAWYNGTRLHGRLGYRSPAEFEEQSKIGHSGAGSEGPSPTSVQLAGTSAIHPRFAMAR